MTTIPSTINILGRWYKIKKGQLESGVLGQTEYASSAIVLSETLPEDRVFEVLIHELVHAAMMETGVDAVLDDKQKEAVCDCVALVFSRIVKLKQEKKTCT